jgi:hypothetical protein
VKTQNSTSLDVSNSSPEGIIEYMGLTSVYSLLRIQWGFLLISFNFTSGFGGLFDINEK